MSEKVNISLVGASSYGTLTATYQRGVPKDVTNELWATLKEVTNPATGAAMFCLTSELPPPPLEVEDQVALVESGLGELDTANQQGMSQVPERDGSDLSDLDATDPAPTPPTDSENAPKVDSAPSTGRKKLTIGSARTSQPVQV